jgi:serine/threonine protein kinase
MTNALDRLKAALADRYAIEQELGSGGMATVYLAEGLKHHRKVAVKVLRPAGLDDPTPPQPSLSASPI